MKKFCLLIFAVALCLSSYAQYVDLRLPSGTKWKSSNETGFYTYEKAVNTFGDKLPTKKQCEELKDKCKWTWNGNGYKVTGPNGQSIVLPASGFRGCDGDVHVADYYCFMGKIYNQPHQRQTIFRL